MAFIIIINHLNINQISLLVIIKAFIKLIISYFKEPFKVFTIANHYLFIMEIFKVIIFMVKSLN